MAAANVQISAERTVTPYVPTAQETIEWHQTAAGVYVCRRLAVDEGGNKIVNVNWRKALELGATVNKATKNRKRGIIVVSSYGEALGVIKADTRAKQESDGCGEWTRNRYQTVREDGAEFTRIFAYLSPADGRFVNLSSVLTSGKVAGIHELGAPDSVSEHPNPEFLDANLYYGNNPLLRGWRGRCAAGAGFGASCAHGALGFRLTYIETKQSKDF